MLSSIHPLGERARNNKWWVTATAFTAGATATGALVGAALGLAGKSMPTSADPSVSLGLTAVAVVVAGALDMSNVKPLGSARQVNEHWIGHYRGWVYGGAFGIQLGAGLATYVVTWGVYATLAGELLTGSIGRGALVGAVFGIGRSLALLLAGRVDRPSRLTSFHRHMAELGPVFRRSSALATVGLGVLAIIAVPL